MQVGATYQTQLDPPPAALRMKREKLQSTGTLAWLRFGRTVSDIEDRELFSALRLEVGFAAIIIGFLAFVRLDPRL